MLEELVVMNCVFLVGSEQVQIYLVEKMQFLVLLQIHLREIKNVLLKIVMLQ